MRLPRPGRHLRLLLLLFLCLAFNICHARPQQQETPAASTTSQSQDNSRGKQMTSDESFFAPGAWRPVGSDTSTEHQLHIDQDRSRVRLEKGDDGKQRGGKSQNTADNQHSTTAPNNNSTLAETSANNTGRAKQSGPLGDTIKTLANQLLDSQSYEKYSDESERESTDEDVASESMVEEDVRTPPKLKSQIKRKQNNQQLKTTKTVSTTTESHSFAEEEINNKGIAVPVIIEDDEDVEKTMEKLSYVQPISTPQSVIITTPKKKITTSRLSTTYRPYYETTSSDGVSTWVLLSGSSSSTTDSHLTSKRKNNKSPTPSLPHTTPIVDLSKSASSYSSSTSPSHETRKPVLGGFGGAYNPFWSTENSTLSTRKPVRTGSQSSGTEPATLNGTRPNIDFFKLTRTRKPNPTRTTTTKTKVTNTVPTTIRTTTIAPEHVSTKRPPVSSLSSSQKTQHKVTTTKPPLVTTIKSPETVTSSLSSTAVVSSEDKTVSSIENNVEGSSTEDISETTTKRTRRPSGNKKRKKNKNRRRRPTKNPEAAENPESKIDDNNATSINNKVAVKDRPLTTRIYNYLAREVMPSVGVGLIGLVVTAGLAGLFMYPFGGGLVTRRTYEETGPPHRMPPSGYYHHGEYGGEMDGGISEEEVFGKLLEGMNDKGEFTYTGIGEDTPEYAGMSGVTGEMSNEQDSRYKNAGGRIENGPTYASNSDVMHGSHQSVRYGGGRIDNSNGYGTRIKYNAGQQGPVTYVQSGDSNESQAYSRSGQQHHGNNNEPMDNTQERYQYSGMATRSEVGDSVRESQPLYSGTVNTGTKRYTSGGVDGNSHHLTQTGVNSELSEYGGPYFKSSFAEAQPYSRNTYDALKVTGGQTYGNVQVDSKSGSHNSGTVAVAEKAPGTKQKTVTESKPQGNQQQRRGIVNSRQQYRDAIGTQPRSGGTIVAISVTKGPGVSKQNNDGTEKPKEQINNSSEDGKVPELKTTAFHQNQKVNNQNHGLDLRHGDISDMETDITSRLSPELQKRGSLLGIMEHGPRNLRRRRDVTTVKPAVPEADVRDNEIESGNSQSDQTKRKEQFTEKPLSGGNSASKNTTSETATSASSVQQNTEGIMMQTSDNLKTDIVSTTETSTVDKEVSTSLLSDLKANDVSIMSVTESTTYAGGLFTTVDLKNDNEVGEGDEDNGEEDEEADEYETTISPQLTTEEDESSTKVPDKEIITKKPEPEFSFLNLIRRIARFKIRMGLNLLKNTSQAFTNYLERVQKRMDKNHNITNSRPFSPQRSKRALASKTNNAKKLRENLVNMSKKQHSTLIKAIQKAVGY